ncbi:MAG: hypothetical protein HS111_33510 [Kofleriaceae bacterium]|nr:hypothetical protein [Kofleriaceae bacterium]
MAVIELHEPGAGRQRLQRPLREAGEVERRGRIDRARQLGDDLAGGEVVADRGERRIGRGRGGGRRRGAGRAASASGSERPVADRRRRRT